MYYWHTVHVTISVCLHLCLCAWMPWSGFSLWDKMSPAQIMLEMYQCCSLDAGLFIVRLSDMMKIPSAGSQSEQMAENGGEDLHVHLGSTLKSYYVSYKTCEFLLSLSLKLVIGLTTGRWLVSIGYAVHSSWLLLMVSDLCDPEASIMKCSLYTVNSINWPVRVKLWAVICTVTWQRYVPTCGGLALSRVIQSGFLKVIHCCLFVPGIGFLNNNLTVSECIL